MKKSLKTLVVSLLSANLIVGSMATIVQAEEDGGSSAVTEPPVDQVSNDNPGGDTGGDTSTGGETGDGTDSGGNNDDGAGIGDDTETGGGETDSGGDNDDENTSSPEDSTSAPEESEESSDESQESSDESVESSDESEESEESDESTDEGTVTQPTYPVGPPSSYVPPRTVPRTPVSTSTDESETSIATQFGINSNVENLESLLAASLEDPNFALAWEDYQSLINDFELNDITSETATMGSTFDEILTNFEGNVVPEQTTTEDGQNVLVFNYSEETEEEGAVPAQIILIGDEAGNLIGSALLQASTAQTTNEAVSAETIQSLVDQENAGLYAQDLFVTALYQLSSNDVTYTSIATPSATEGAYEFITIDNEYVLNHTTGEAEETSLLNQLQDSIATYIEGIENQPEEEVTEEPSEEATETGDEEVSVDEETAEEEPTNQFVKRFAPANYEELTLLDGETIISGYEELSGMVDGVTLTVTPEELSDLLGEPSKEQVAGNSTYYDYYSVEDERIVLLTLQVDSSSNVVTTMKYDIRTPRLDEEFAINVEELFALAETELSIENLRNSLDDANIVEHIFAGGHQIRHVWTSYTDPEMRNVEAYEDTETGNVELFYYDQD